MAGAASSTGIGAVRTGSWPLVGSDCGPLRYGKKSTALEVWSVEPVALTVATPLTGFSGVCGFVVGEIAGPGSFEWKRRPHQLPSAISRLP